MSCCSSCGGCGCSQCNYIVNLPDNPTDEYTAANIGVGGVGVYDSQSGFQFGFRNVNSANAMLTVTLDAPNAVVLLTVDAAAIAAAFPAATTAQAGILETATDAEAIAKAATDKIVTPSNFAAMAASTTFAGFAEIATQAEVTAGVASTVFVAPDTLAVLLATKKYTVTFADNVARAALAPAFEGQFGYQLDSNQPYVGTGVAAGDWNLVFVEGVVQTIDENTEIDIDGVAFAFSGTGALNVSVTTTNLLGDVFVAAGFTANPGSTVDLSGTTLSIVDATINPAAASAVLVTDAGSTVQWQLINTFISSANTQTGWSVTNPSVSRTLDVSAATLGDVRAVLGTLINDLKGIKLPAA